MQEYINMILEINYKQIAILTIDIVILTIAFLVLHRILRFVIRKAVKSSFKGNPERIDTIISIVYDLEKYLIIPIYLVSVMGILGINIAVLLTSVGLLVFILTFALQELIRDFVNGFFMVFEGYYDVGDYVEVDGYEGFVIALGIKSTTLRTYEGEIVYIPNSKVVEIKNFSKQRYEMYKRIAVPYEEPYARIEMVANVIVGELQKNQLVYSVNYLGVDELADSSINILLHIVMDADNRYAVNREINRLVKLVFDSYKMTIPYNQLVVHSGE